MMMPAAFTAQIIDQDRKPVPYFPIRVNFLRQGYGNSKNQKVCCWTDAEGRFSLACGPVSDFGLFLCMDGYVPWERWCETGSPNSYIRGTPEKPALIQVWRCLPDVGEIKKLEGKVWFPVVADGQVITARIDLVRLQTVGPGEPYDCEVTIDPGVDRQHERWQLKMQDGRIRYYDQKPDPLVGRIPFNDPDSYSKYSNASSCFPPPGIRLLDLYELDQNDLIQFTSMAREGNWIELSCRDKRIAGMVTMKLSPPIQRNFQNNGPRGAGDRDHEYNLFIEGVLNLRGSPVINQIDTRDSSPAKDGRSIFPPMPPHPLTGK